MSDLISPDDQGYTCTEGFTIDPETPVDTAVVSHGHADHGAMDSDEVHCSKPTAAILEERYGISAEGHRFGEAFDLNGATVSLHPAGHILGSAMILVEHGGERWLYTGDYKHRLDPSTEDYEPVACDVLITETTFALPIYQWRSPESILDDIAVWTQSVGEETTCFVFAYSLGKAQRVIRGLADRGITPWVHGSVDDMNAVYQDQGVALPDCPRVDLRDDEYRGDVVVAPQGVHESTTVQRMSDAATAMVSGWMRVRGNRRWRNYDRGFALSDHCDWQALCDTVADCDPDEVKTVHGYTEAFARYVEDNGLEAEAWE